MRLNIKVNKDTSELLLKVIDTFNKVKIGDLDKEKEKLQLLLDELDHQLADSVEKLELIHYFESCINQKDNEIITVDKDPNIIDNKNLISITTNKMEKKDLIKQELSEIESILSKKSYSQLLSLYHARLFSDIEGLTGEEVDELKERLDSISEQLEDISNGEVTSDESVEVTDEATETPDETESTEESTEEVTEEAPAEETEEATEETTEETEEPAEESAEESSESEVVEESETEETQEEVPAEETEEVTEETEEPVEVPEEVAEKIEEVDAALEELKEAVDTKDFSKVIARVHNRLFSEIEAHEDIIENIDEVKAAMDDLAEKLEAMDAEVDDDHEDAHEAEEEVVDDAEHAEEETHDAEEEETKEESAKCLSGFNVIFEDGTTRYFKDEDELKRAQENEADFGIIREKVYADAEEEVVTDETVETPAEEPAEEKETVEAVAEQAAEEAVEDYMEGSLYLDEPDESMDMSVVDEVVEQPEEVIEPTYIDEKTDAVMDVHDAEDYSEDVDMDDYENADEELYLENDTFSEHRSSLTREFSVTPEFDGMRVASIEELLGFE